MAGHAGSKRCPVVASSRQVVGTLMDVTRRICLTQSCLFSEVRICVSVAWEVIVRCHVSKEYSATVFTVSVKLDALRFHKISVPVFETVQKMGVRIAYLCLVLSLQCVRGSV